MNICKQKNKSSSIKLKKGNKVVVQEIEKKDLSGPHKERRGSSNIQQSKGIDTGKYKRN